MSEISIAIHGAAGRMGRRLVALCENDPDLKLAAAVDAATCRKLGEDAGTLAGVGEVGVPITVDLPEGIDVVIDFSLPDGAEAIIETCHERKIPIVVATTALSDAQTAKLHAAARDIAVCWAPNMSLAVNLAMKLTDVAAHALADMDADVEIIERHHRFKEDSPSGTALKFGEIVTDAMEQSVHRHGREGRIGSRPHDEIGYHAIRAGDNPGEHTIIFGMLGETLEISVAASNRNCYAVGGLAAAKFLVGKPAGLYSMKDVLDLH